MKSNLIINLLFVIIFKQNKTWKIVEGLPINDFSREKMDLTAKELAEEKETAFEFLSSAWLDNRFDVTKCSKAEESKCRL